MESKTKATKSVFTSIDNQNYILNKFETLIQQDKNFLYNKHQTLKKAAIAYNNNLEINYDNILFDLEKEKIAFNILQKEQKDYELLISAYGLGLFDITNTSEDVEEDFENYIEQASDSLKPVIKHIAEVTEQLQAEYKTIIEE